MHLVCKYFVCIYFNMLCLFVFVTVKNISFGPVVKFKGTYVSSTKNKKNCHSHFTSDIITLYYFSAAMGSFYHPRFHNVYTG